MGFLEIEIDISVVIPKYKKFLPSEGESPGNLISYIRYREIFKIAFGLECPNVMTAETTRRETFGGCGPSSLRRSHLVSHNYLFHSELKCRWKGKLIRSESA
jgi:hypothetical protein